MNYCGSRHPNPKRTNVGFENIKKDFFAKDSLLVVSKRVVGNNTLTYYEIIWNDRKYTFSFPVNFK